MSLGRLPERVAIRGAVETSGSLFSHVDMEAQTPSPNPLRQIRRVVNGALAGLLQIPLLVRVTPEACLRHDAATGEPNGLQSDAPLVREAGHRRGRLG